MKPFTRNQSPAKKNRTFFSLRDYYGLLVRAAKGEHVNLRQLDAEENEYLKQRELVQKGVEFTGEADLQYQLLHGNATGRRQMMVWTRENIEADNKRLKVLDKYTTRRGWRIRLIDWLMRGIQPTDE